MTPYEKLFGRKLEVGHLQCFGCKAFKSLPASHHSKFDTRAHPLFILGYVHDSTTIWGFWDPHRRQVIQASTVTFLESVVLRLGALVRLGLGATSELNSLGGLRLDALAVGLGRGASSELNSSGGFRLDISAVRLGLGTSRELDSSGGLRLDASAVGLGLGTSSKINSSGGLRLDTSVVGLGLTPSTSREFNSLGRLDYSAVGLGLSASAVRLGLSTSSGSLGNLEANNIEYDLRKRPRAVTH